MPLNDIKKLFDNLTSGYQYESHKQGDPIPSFSTIKIDLGEPHDDPHITDVDDPDIIY